MDKHPVLMKINTPFCARKCSFCRRDVIGGRDSGLIHDYVMALAVELSENAEEFSDCRIQAIRLGGGCASVLDGADFEKLQKLMQEQQELEAALEEKTERWLYLTDLAERIEKGE